MTVSATAPHYFPHMLPISAAAYKSLDLDNLLVGLSKHQYPRIIAYRRIAAALNSNASPGAPAVSPATLLIYGTILSIWRYLIDEVAGSEIPNPLPNSLMRAGIAPDAVQVQKTCHCFYALFPPSESLAQKPLDLLRPALLREMLLLNAGRENRALDPFRQLFDDQELASSSPYRDLTAKMEQSLSKAPLLPGFDLTLPELLKAPLKAAPDSLAKQLGFIREQWGKLLPPELLQDVLVSFDVLDEEQRQRSSGGGPGPSRILRFGGSDAEESGSNDAENLSPEHMAGYDQPEYEAFSSDADWMSNVVMIAKMTHVWLDQLSKKYGYPITMLDQVPDAELDRLATYGFTGLWLIGLWERSPASRRIKEICGNPDAHASAYSLFDYVIADDLGGEKAFFNLKDRAWKKGIRLASDMVPNHTGIYSRWLLEHPHWFVQTDYCPFPTYQFNGEDLSHDPAVTIQIEDGYWSKHDAAVVFRMIDRRDGRTRYIYHGNDGTSIPWNDTAQLDYLIAEVREAVIQTILHVARLTPIIRFDAAMTLAKKHYQRLWFPQRGLGGGIPSRAEHAMGRDEFDAVFPVEFWREVVDRMAVEAPDTLLLAEAFWMMEGYFVRTLGMHRVYNSAFMNMLKQEENHKYRQTMKNVLEFNPEILKRFVNFMNNPDEKTAIEQFGAQGKYFGACILLSTMPGLPMFGHGQIEGFREKYGMEYRRAYWDEAVDEGMVRGHELWIFPLLKRRHLFSGSEHFTLFDFTVHDGSVDENVFAYSNRSGNERALVLYHNRYGNSSGWVRDSVSFVSKNDSGESGLCRTTLAAALGVEGLTNHYLLFRDISCNLEFIRPVEELQQRGLYAELGEYQFHVFLDFRVVLEEQDGRWGRLCSNLGGCGVPSLTDELIQIEHGPLIAAFEKVLSELPAKAGSGFSGKELTVALERYLEYQLSVTDSAELEQIVETLRLIYDPAVCCSALRLLRRSGLSANFLKLSGRERRLTIATLLLRLLTVDPRIETVLGKGIERPLAAYIAADEAQDREKDRWDLTLCCAAATAWELWSASADLSTADAMAAVFEPMEVQRFLLVHEDKGTVWFNKERMDELLRRMALQAAFDEARGKKTDPVPVLLLSELAAAAGYKLRRMLKLAEEMFV